ncbi:unnamed protein product [Didymodactylos carnosus]|uniref:Uncharacterized protein n=1 Tax=Didymodactylos carnosus TaxID=1234261 RepID=A0A814C611_9BILA|nr:unnamed protein product [Didymodactylos carnosus]CAF1140033.1 unnamed protein product [Didymodactylos carnosus]CAF3715033.1 unnamed protein product [Didymodactylos carnosus]CAF3933899.1 unnamed protein product [Didymodactylos carnosus]
MTPLDCRVQSSLGKDRFWTAEDNSEEQFYSDSNLLPIDDDSLDSSFKTPSFYDRFIRSTKMPRIGRSADFDDLPLPIKNYLLSSSSSLGYYLPGENTFEQRSVMFPRIGKRAFHNLLWANGRANPHRVLDAQGRYLTTNYDLQRTAPARWRGKRAIAVNTDNFQ